MDPAKENEEKDRFISCLEEIAECVPGNFYWKDKNGTYLGCNKSLLFGCGYGDVIGKTDYDLWPNQAEELRENDVKVMTSGAAMHFEEFIQCGDGTTLYFTVVKIPLKNTKGEIVGTIGNSLDITYRKEAEKLRIENESHKITIKEQKKFQKVADQVIHDMRTPLYVLLSCLKTCKNLSEREYIKLREAVNSIKNIAQIFLEYSSDKEETADRQYIPVSLALEEVMGQKEIQYSGSDIEFRYFFDPSLRFVFICGNALNFERMISNLISNSVEALEGKKGIVKVSLSLDKYGNNVKIVVQDNGKGMSPEMVEILMKNEPIPTTKADGFGIGTSQIRDVMKEFNGKQFVESKRDIGTKITLAIPKAGDPKWLIKKIELRKGDTVIVLDDDVLAHRMWKERLKQYRSGITLKFFENGRETCDFINSFKKKDKIVLLSDCELRYQRLDGLDVIQNSGMNNFRSVIVSSIYNRREIQERADSLGIKILPKAFIDDVQLTLDGKEDVDPSSSGANVVVLDDEKYFADNISDVLRSKGMEVDTYYNPGDLIKNLSRYDINIKIVMDNYFQGDITGEDFAKKLFESGFERVCLLTGAVNIANTLLKYPKGTKIISKGSDNFDEDLLYWCKKSF
ncbi:MAG: PAS domain-containing sensor histidine kinase [Holosporaceae bacterium]|jgi:PAS domain S-box-containing protein|nr:PAS domain-containing sensor histidine kinase [Holosporaceae bacterium]